MTGRQREVDELVDEKDCVKAEDNIVVETFVRVGVLFKKTRDIR